MKEKAQSGEVLREKIIELLRIKRDSSSLGDDLQKLLHTHNHQLFSGDPSSSKGNSFNFIDLFAGAGGVSEGFLQAEVDNKYFNFVLASDINENCELTHVVRYNHQLGLNMQFLCQDITEFDFLDNLLKCINDREIDVVCGGPPCQSFSLAGKRKKFDKKDDLFSHYLTVIKKLQPKYFVMENVKGILTKDHGRVKDRILKEINSIVDIRELYKLTSFLKTLRGDFLESDFILEVLIKKIEIEKYLKEKKSEKESLLIQLIETKFRKLTPKIVDYKTSKTDKRISTIRHGFNILARYKKWNKLRDLVIHEKDCCDIDNDFFIDSFTSFLDVLKVENVVNNISESFTSLNISKKYHNEIHDILTALKIYTYTFDETVDFIKSSCDKVQVDMLKKVVSSIRLYKIEQPLVVNASDYGVPQNRERVLFIGCRKDQEFISEIPPTVSSDEKVSVFEALHDLDFISNNQECLDYKPVTMKPEYQSLVRNRSVTGAIDKEGKTFAEWSKTGRLGKSSCRVLENAFYVGNKDDLMSGKKIYNNLHNHKTSKQSDDVIRRLQIILDAGGYRDAQRKLEKSGLTSKKRNYNVLKADEQSPTVMTIPDDYIHYEHARSLTVREMARLQSFDDSFVFQGKRSTGGNNRKSEVPQFTLVGNAVPPLLARAVASEILKKIK